MDRERSSLIENIDMTLVKIDLPFKESSNFKPGLHEEKLSVGYSIAASVDLLEARPASRSSSLSMNEAVKTLKCFLQSANNLYNACHDNLNNSLIRFLA